MLPTIQKLIKECNPEIELDKEPESLAGNSKKQEKMEHSKEVSQFIFWFVKHIYFK